MAEAESDSYWCDSGHQIRAVGVAEYGSDSYFTVGLEGAIRIPNMSEHQGGGPGTASVDASYALCLVIIQKVSGVAFRINTERRILDYIAVVPRDAALEG